MSGELRTSIFIRSFCLNLAFSLQAAYAAPLILLAQTRQADRDKAHAEADAGTGKPWPLPVRNVNFWR